jgi:hypothetical protein
MALTLVVPISLAGLPQPIAVAAQTAQIDQIERTPDRVVEHLLSLPHGLYSLGPSDQALMIEVKSRPDAFVSALKARYADVNPLELKDSELVRRWARSCLLLTELGTPEALSQLITWFFQADDAADVGSKREMRALHARAVILSALSGVRVDPIIQRILARLDNLDYAAQGASMQYLASSTVGDTDVAAKLRGLLADEQSTLYLDQALQRTIQTISGEKNQPPGQKQAPAEEQK